MNQAQHSELSQQPALFELEPIPERMGIADVAAASNDATGNRSGAVNKRQLSHLRAAKRLSRAIRAQKADPQAQTATGLAICRHLIAMLDD